jgi:hypothetical protein
MFNNGGRAMNASIVFGLFALYVASISLYLVLSGRQEPLLEILRRVWGRTLGHAFYFIVNVGLPLVLCVVYLGWGVRQYDPTLVSYDPHNALQLNLESYRDLRSPQQHEKTQEMIDIIYGA